MATKQLSDIDINIRLTDGKLTCDASVSWSSPDVPEMPPLNIPLSIAVDAGDTISDILARCDAAAEMQLQRGSDVIEKPSRPETRR